MLYISARNSSIRFSLLIGKSLANVISQLSMRVWGIGSRLPAPAFPKHDMSMPMPVRGLACSVRLHGLGSANAALLKMALPGVPFTPILTFVGPPLKEA